MSASSWDDRYRGSDYAYGREPNEFLRAEGARIPTGSVLCLAEGMSATVQVVAMRAER